MSMIRNLVNELHLGKAVEFEGLQVTPLLSGYTSELDYVLLDEALAAGDVVIRELSEQGSVPELALDNGGTRPILALDGEELVGAKQNRILNLTILAPAGKVTVIPVSCVEAGRWDYKSREFSTSDRAFYSRGRASKLQQVSDSLEHSNSRRSDQGAIWEDISMKSMRFQTSSKTSAMAAMFEERRGSIDSYVKALVPGKDEVGAVFSSRGRILGLDVFDRASTYARIAAKLIRSNALEVLDPEPDGESRNPGGRSTSADIAGFLKDIAAAECKAYKAVGLGEDLRFELGAAMGAALQEGDRILHLSAFPQGAHGRRARADRVVI